MSSASTNAMTTRNGSSRKNEPFFGAGSAASTGVAVSVTGGPRGSRRGQRPAAPGSAAAARDQASAGADGAAVGGAGVAAVGAGVLFAAAVGTRERFSLIFAFLPRSSRR